MKRNGTPRLALLCLLAALLLSACGQRQTVSVFDSGVTTTMELRLPKTVGAILECAEIMLRDGDEVIPALDVVLREPAEITVRRECVVLLNVYGEVRTAAAYGLTVGQLLEREGITLKKEQHINYAPETYLKNGMEIRISDEVRVSIRHDGVTDEVSVAAKTVGDALAERGIALALEDRVTPSADSPTAEGQRITVERVRYEIEERTEPMAFETVYIKDPKLPYDSEELSVEGKDGLHRVRYRVTMTDGEEESREILSETVLEAPVDQVVRRGPKDPHRVSVVSKKIIYDCDGSGHGYYEILYSDGSVEYERF